MAFRRDTPPDTLENLQWRQTDNDHVSLVKHCKPLILTNHHMQRTIILGRQKIMVTNTTDDLRALHG